MTIRAQVQLAYGIDGDVTSVRVTHSRLTTFTDRTTTQEESGEPYAATSMRSLIWCKVGDDWVIAHEHTSALPALD